MSDDPLRRLIRETAGVSGARRALDLALGAATEAAGAPALVALVELGRVIAAADEGLEPPSDEELAHAAQRVLDGKEPFPEGALVGRATTMGEGVALVAIPSSAPQRSRFEERVPVILLGLARAALLLRDRRRSAEVERLNETAQRVAAFLDVDRVLHEIVRDAVELIGADSGDIVLQDEGSGAMRVVAVANLPDDMVGFELAADEGVSPRAMAARRTIIVADYRQYRHRVRRLDRYGFRAIVSAPLVAREQAIGVLNVHTVRGEHRFTREDARLLQTFANHAAIAIDNARRYENEARLARDLARVNQELARSLTLQQRLAEQVLLDRGPAAVVEELSTLLNRPVVLQDEVLRVIAGATPHPEQPWEALALLRGSLSDELVGPFLRELGESRRAAAAPPPPLQGPERLVAPLRAGPGVSGYLIVPAGRPVSSLDRALIEVASTGVALEMAKLRARVEVEAAIRGEVVADLLAGAYSGPEAIASRAARLGYDLTEPRDVILIDADIPVDGEDPAVVRRRLLDRVEETVDEHAPGSIVAAQGDAIAVLAPPGDGNGRGRSPHSLVEAVRMRAAADLAGVAVSAAIGDRCVTAQDYAASYRLARQGLEAIRRLGLRERVVDARHLGVARLLVGSAEPEELAAFARRTLGPLLPAGDQGGQLLLTLRTYVESGFNQRETARRCFVHINTVAYRLRRIEALLGVDLSDPETLMDLTFALRIVDLVGPQET